LYRRHRRLPGRRLRAGIVGRHAGFAGVFRGQSGAYLPDISLDAFKAFFHAFDTHRQQVIIARAAFFKGGEAFVCDRPGAGCRAQKDDTRQQVFRAHGVPRPDVANLSPQCPGACRRRVVSFRWISKQNLDIAQEPDIGKAFFAWAARVHRALQALVTDSGQIGLSAVYESASVFFKAVCRPDLGLRRLRPARLEVHSQLAGVRRAA
jgi:hypothetical protein